MTRKLLSIILVAVLCLLGPSANAAGDLSTVRVVIADNTFHSTDLVFVKATHTNKIDYSATTGLEGFSGEITHIATDGLGYVYVADISGGQGKIERLESAHYAEGRVLLYSAPTSAFNPRYLVADGLGNVYVSEPGRGVSMLSSGGVLTPVETRVSNPGEIGFDVNHNLYVADRDLGRIVQVRPNGHIYGSPVANYSGSFCLDPFGNILVATGGGMRRLEPDGAVVSVSVDTRNVYDFNCGPYGNIWISRYAKGLSGYGPNGGSLGVSGVGFALAR